MQKRHILKYYTPAEDSLEGWEEYSLPLGNGYFGASIFGRTDVERIQFTTNVFANDKKRGGVSNFAEIRIHFGHTAVRDYERGLNLSEGFAYTRCALNENLIENRAFFSYPDKVFVYRITSTKATDFSVRLVIPYLNERTIEEGGRTGEVFAQGNVLTMRGSLPFRELLYEGKLLLCSNGSVAAEGDSLLVQNATETTLFFVADTSYKLDERVFLTGNHKAIGENPHKKVVEGLQKAFDLGEAKLFERHQADYLALMSRVEFDLGGKEDARSTEELLESNRKGNFEPYLEEIYYQYGRYLLVSSSRKGTPPASLQGVWNAHDQSPWGSGFWHNINVQMNYWPAFNTNLAETFTAYADYNKAFRRQAENLASAWIKEFFPENYVEGQGACGWTIGTAAYCYEIDGQSKGSHSGPGTGGLTTKLFWDYYDFTRDEKVLKEVTYPAIHGMSKFLSKCVREYDGEYLSAFSASPEQIIGGAWVTGRKRQPYYHTIGCAFDQQMIYENAQDDLKCAQLLGVFDETTELERKQMNTYSPVLVGYSGQIKEYREEHFYGEIGEAQHRHISQLVALMPGTLINQTTPAWLDAAKQTLTLRGDESTGWALAHRLCAWARAGEGDHAYLLLQNLLKMRTHPNLWDVHPPFQIDGNFGALNGMTEMLLQSHEGYVHLIPALPISWETLSFKGLKARGNFTISCDVKQGNVTKAEIYSVVGGEIRIRHKGMRGVTVRDSKGNMVEAATDDFTCAFFTKPGETYTLAGFEKFSMCDAPTSVSAKYEDSCVKLTWDGKERQYAIYRAVNGASDYQLLGYTKGSCFEDKEYSASNKQCLTYKVTAVNGVPSQESKGAVVFLHPAGKLETERYAYILRQNNL